jgi:hypothetical protein
LDEQHENAKLLLIRIQHKLLEYLWRFESRSSFTRYASWLYEILLLPMWKGHPRKSSRDTVREWLHRNQVRHGQNNIANAQFIHQQKIFLPLLHIERGTMKISVEAMNRSEFVRNLVTNFS